MALTRKLKPITHDGCMQTLIDHTIPPRSWGRPFRVKLANNTILECDGHGDDFVVRLHGHTIIRVHKDRTYTLSSCGHRTVTTKQRLNKLTPATVFQRRGEWFIGKPRAGGWEGKVPFRDGVRVDGQGRPIPQGAEASHWLAAVAALPGAPWGILADYAKDLAHNGRAD
jgi:hypothetical protein